MESIYIEFKNGKMVKSATETDFFLDWDGVYYIYYGGQRHYTYEGVTYDCFPIVTIAEDLSRVEDISLFGCEGDKQSEDGYLFHLPMDFDLWPNCVPFEKLNNYSNLF